MKWLGVIRSYVKKVLMNILNLLLLFVVMIYTVVHVEYDTSQGEPVAQREMARHSEHHNAFESEKTVDKQTDKTSSGAWFPQTKDFRIQIGVFRCVLCAEMISWWFCQENPMTNLFWFAIDPMRQCKTCRIQDNASMPEAKCGSCTEKFYKDWMNALYIWM